MPITIKPIGALKSYLVPLGEQQVLAEGLTVREILAALGIPSELVALVLVNEAAQEKSHIPQEGDVVKLLAVIGGGSG